MEALNNMVLEIGTEELPAGFIPPALKQLKERAIKELGNERLDFEDIKTSATPRRLVLFIKGLSSHQKEMVKEVKGPPSKVAYASDGNPTPAAMGFARAQNVEVNNLFIKTLPQGEYVFAKVTEPRKEAIEVLCDLLPSIMKNLYFPKNMYWDDSGIKFARPVRWVLALLDSQVIKFKFGNMESDRITYGHRFLSNGAVEVPHCDDFKDVLMENKVVLDIDERKKMILEQMENLIKDKGFKLLKPETLLEEVNFLVEYPTSFIGNFSPDYLDLPVELLTTVMSKHQRYFSLVDNEGNILPHFIAVRNGDTRGLDLVTIGNERVLTARLADGKYFFETDKKSTLHDGLPKLKDIGFQKNLGSMYDKTLRLMDLSCFIVNNMGKEELCKNARRASELCKADLASLMVFEFPELQGIIGGIYSSFDGEEEIVSEAIRTHYMPAFSQDGLPLSILGQIISFADKLDSAAGCFGAGYIPTGSADPYGVRRNTLGFLRILLDGEVKGDLLSYFSKAIGLYKEQGFSLKDEGKIEEEFEQFTFQRLENYLLSRNYRYDVIKAVRKGALKDLKDACRKIEALMAIRELPEFEPLVGSFTRASNILKKSLKGSPSFSSNALVDEQEKLLYKEFEKTSKEVNEILEEKRDYKVIMQRLSSLRPFIDSFFDNVMVMVPDEELRDNRLALLDMVVALYLKVADFSEIVVEGEQG